MSGPLEENPGRLNRSSAARSAPPAVVPVPGRSETSWTVPEARGPGEISWTGSREFRTGPGSPGRAEKFLDGPETFSTGPKFRRAVRIFLDCVQGFSGGSKKFWTAPRVLDRTEKAQDGRRSFSADLKTLDPVEKVSGCRRTFWTAPENQEPFKKILRRSRKFGPVPGRLFRCKSLASSPLAAFEFYLPVAGSGLTQKAWSAVAGIAQGARKGCQAVGSRATIAPCNVPWLDRVSSKYPN